MHDKKKEFSRYYLGEKILIGHRDNHTLFWLKTDKNNWEPGNEEKYWQPGNEYRDDRTLYWINNENYWESDKSEFNVLEAGKAWIDEKTDTTILDFPTSDKVEINNLKKEFLQSSGWISHYKESNFYVQLSECSRNSPEKTKKGPINYIDDDYELPEHLEGYVLNENTFLIKNYETGELHYLKFSEFSENDFENDRFGWIKSAREYFAFPSDEELMSRLEWFRKESYGEAWIDGKNNVLVLGPVNKQEIEALDHNYDERISSYLGLYSEWDQTKIWIDIESGFNRNPFDYKLNYFYLLEKYVDC